MTSTVKIKALLMQYVNYYTQIYLYTYECAVSIPILKIAFLKHVLSKVRFLFH